MQQAPPSWQFSKRAWCGFKEQFARAPPPHLWDCGPPQMWTVGSLVGISESVLERSKAKASLVILCLLLGRSVVGTPTRPQDSLGQVLLGNPVEGSSPISCSSSCHLPLECLLCSVLFGKLHSRIFKEKTYNSSNFTGPVVSGKWESNCLKIKDMQNWGGTVTMKAARFEINGKAFCEILEKKNKQMVRLGRKVGAGGNCLLLLHHPAFISAFP